MYEMQLEHDEYSETIPEFPRYAVTSFGRVFNKKTARDMRLYQMDNGDVVVGLIRGSDGTQHQRMVKRLVARAFVPGESERFNTPIILDGNKRNLNATNLAWRPRWFAVRYARQFSDDQPEWFWSGPVLDTVHDEHFNSIFMAAIHHGSLCADIRAAIPNGTAVFPTGERYVYI